MITKMKTVFLLAMALLLCSCANIDEQIIGESKVGQASLRSVQTRVYETTNQREIVKSVISSLQDLDFVVDKADATLGTVSATRLSHNQTTTITVSVRSHGKKSAAVRANVRYGLMAVENPKIYQDFFTVLSKNLFLDAHSID